jgi:hypothetical protein
MGNAGGRRKQHHETDGAEQNRHKPSSTSVFHAGGQPGFILFCKSFHSRKISDERVKPNFRTLWHTLPGRMSV